ncbi:MAG: nucleotidyltransferase [Candidatus Marinimicrobia bacterium]|nr:nucleotidyltransferase [Candidatus Neomarinimicrobiota bacterium]
MKNILVKANITIREAMKHLDQTAEKCLLVIDDNLFLLGTLTDGDLRRSILSGIKFSNDISSSFNTNPTILVENNFNNEDAKKLLQTLKIDLIPIVDDNNRVVDYYTWSDLDDAKINVQVLDEVPVVIMAGGKGSRLEPFTNVLPKPLVPIHEKPIIEHIIEKFTEIGCLKFYLSINYKGKILKAYFDELDPIFTYEFIDESKPLGTAGSLHFLKDKINKPFFVTNCDIIIKTNYEKLYKFHIEAKYDITLVASAKEYVIPYGTCELTKNGNLHRINEKPKYDFLVNTGLYLLNPNVLEIIPKNKFYHITNLIEDAKDLGLKIGVYPINDDAWTDIGQWAEYKKVIDSL